MDGIRIKEKINKIKFLISRINYKREKNLFIVIFFSILLISMIFSIVLIKQKNEIARKENILKSYYETGGSVFANKKNIMSGSSMDNISDNSGNSINNSNNGKTNNNEGASIIGDPENSTGNNIKAYICGCVVNPGVYELENGSRVIDLLNRAGGPAKDACLESINLALILTDCAKIYLPSIEEIKKGKSLFFSFNNYNMISPNSADDSANIGNGINKSTAVRLININQASNTELELLPGIGSKIAEDIVDYRNNNGFFKSKEDLKNIKGIGEKKYEKIKDLISI